MVASSPAQSPQLLHSCSWASVRTSHPAVADSAARLNVKNAVRMVGTVIVLRYCFTVWEISLILCMVFFGRPAAKLPDETPFLGPRPLLHFHICIFHHPVVPALELWKVSMRQYQHWTWLLTHHGASSRLSWHKWMQIISYSFQSFQRPYNPSSKTIHIFTLKRGWGVNVITMSKEYKIGKHLFFDMLISHLVQQKIDDSILSIHGLIV